MGQWEWSPADKKHAAGMHCGNGSTLVQIPIKAKPGQIWRVSLRVTFAARAGEYLAAWGTWTVPHATSKMNECWISASPRMSGDLKIYSITYLQIKQSVMLYYQDGDPIEEPTSIQVRVGDNPDPLLMVVGLENCRRHEIEIEEVTLEEIPEPFRDVRRLIKERKMMPKPQRGSPIQR